MIKMMEVLNIEKETYVSPKCEIVTVDMEGAIAVVSGGPYNGFNHNGGDEQFEW